MLLAAWQLLCFAEKLIVQKLLCSWCAASCLAAVAYELKLLCSWWAASCLAAVALHQLFVSFLRENAQLTVVPSPVRRQLHPVLTLLGSEGVCFYTWFLNKKTKLEKQNKSHAVGSVRDVHNDLTIGSCSVPRAEVVVLLPQKAVSSPDPYSGSDSAIFR